MGALPPRPPPPINGGPSHFRLLPALPCRPGETPDSNCGKGALSVCRLLAWYRSFTAAEDALPPARRVGPGDAVESEARRLSLAGVLGVRPPSRRPPLRNGGDFFGSFLVAQKGTYTNGGSPPKNTVPSFQKLFFLIAFGQPKAIRKASLAAGLS